MNEVGVGGDDGDVVLVFAVVMGLPATYCCCFIVVCCLSLLLQGIAQYLYNEDLTPTMRKVLDWVQLAVNVLGELKESVVGFVVVVIVCVVVGVVVAAADVVCVVIVLTANVVIVCVVVVLTANVVIVCVVVLTAMSSIQLGHQCPKWIMRLPFRDVHLVACFFERHP